MMFSPQGRGRRDTDSDPTVGSPLRRAQCLVTPNGHLSPGFEDKSDEGSDSTVLGSDSSGSKLSRNRSLGASIKRKLQDNPLVRSISARSPSLTRKSRQSRAFSSDSTTPRPQVVQDTDLGSAKPLHGPHSSLSSSNSNAKIKPRKPHRKSMADVAVPQLLQQGVPMTKVSASRQKTYVFQLDPDQGQILWVSKKQKIIPIENIKELRSASDARYYREQFQLAQEYEERWLTIIYIMDGSYKTLHLIAATKDVFQMWDITLRKLYTIRQELMSGLGNVEMRQAVWEKQYWKGADEGGDQRLDFEETERLCKRLNVNSSTDTLLRLFKQADTENNGYLEFTQFQHFVKMLKARPELDRLHRKLASANDGVFNFQIFEAFMRDSQKTSLSQLDLWTIFIKYATPPVTPGPVPTSPSLPANADSYTLTPDGFTVFLLSTDNSAFTDQDGKTWHDMTRPLSEYYISTSHNTYLVGHQLVGVSTIEGYIRALLHSCRSVELDIYDGEKEPVVFHGKTLTTKVAVRQVCQAIAKYAFVASPYPVIISAEIHCSLPQQDMIADIMSSTFGDTLVKAPIDGQAKIEVLPSPEALKGKILLKAKNLYVSASESARDKETGGDVEMTETETETSSAEDSEVMHVVHDARYEWHKAREAEGHAVKELKDELKKVKNSEAVKDIKEEFKKARHNVFGHITGHHSPVVQAVVGPPASIATTIASSGKSGSEKVKMSMAVVGLLVYTVGVKCRGINKKEQYAPEHVFSLSETTANKILKHGMHDLIKHNRTHVVRIYPKGSRFDSTNYEPHRYWSAGAQLVAINWQTCDMGYMINHAMFQRNGRSGYVLKPLALRSLDKELLSKRTKHVLDIKIISAQQLPRLKDASGREIVDKAPIDPFVEVSIHVPDWTHSPYLPTAKDTAAYTAPNAPTSSVSTIPIALPAATPSPKRSSSTSSSLPTAVSPSNVNSSARTVTYRTGVVKNNGFNPVWQEDLHLPFDCVGEMMDLVFVRFAVRHEGRRDEDEPLAVYCASLGSLQRGYRHLPLHDAQLSQYLFSTLFVQINVHDT